MANCLRVKFIKTHWDFKQLPGEYASLSEENAQMLIELGCAVLASEETTPVVQGNPDTKKVIEEMDVKQEVVKVKTKLNWTIYAGIAAFILLAGAILLSVFL
jgi:hypothetical protein